MDACFDTWIDAMAKWYHVQLVANLVMIRIDGTGKPLPPEGVGPGLGRIVVEDCPALVKAALLKLERPVAPEVVEVLADRAVALRLTQELQGRIGKPTLAVCRLVVAKPYAPCRLWWGSVREQGSWASLYNECGEFVCEGAAGAAAHHVVSRFLFNSAGGFIPGDAKPIEAWFKARPDGPWALTADEVGKLLEGGAGEGVADA